MTNWGFLITFSTFLLCTFFTWISCNPLKLRSITDDLNDLMNLAGGDYDNYAQYKSDIDKGLPVKDRHMHLNAQFFETKIPDLGENSFFYVQEYENGNASQVYSQSVNSFYINITTWTIHMRIYKFVSPDVAKKFINASQNPEIFKELRLDQLTYNDGCGVTWARTGPKMFVGKMTLGACVLPYMGTNVIIYDENILSTGYLTVHEQWFIQSNGTRIVGNLSPYNETRQPTPDDNNQYFIYRKFDFLK